MTLHKDMVGKGGWEYCV